MQSFLAKCAAVGIVAGGFTLTGDVGRLADRGRRLIDARTVPSEAAVDTAAGVAVDAGREQHGVQEVAPPPPREIPPGSVPVRSDAAPAVAAPRSPSTSADRPTTWIIPGEAPADAPVGRTFTVPTPPTSGPDSLDLRQLTAGRRVLVWVRRPAVTGRGSATDLIAFDIIDPRSAEALEHRHAALSHGSQATTVHAAARRVVIVGDATGRIVRGGTLGLAPLHGVNGLGPAEKAGTIVAIDLQGR